MWCGVVAVLALIFAAGVQAAETKIGIINMQKVVADSAAGKKAKQDIDEKMKELKTSFQADEEALIALQKEIEKISSAWSEDMKQEKAIEFKKKRRDLGVKQEDAKLEMKRLQEQHLGPILKKLEEVVDKVATDKGFTLVLPRNAVLFSAESADITADVTKALDKAMK